MERNGRAKTVSKSQTGLFPPHTARPNNCASGPVVAHLNLLQDTMKQRMFACLKVTIAARFITDQEPRLEQIITA